MSLKSTQPESLVSHIVTVRVSAAAAAAATACWFLFYLGTRISSSLHAVAADRAEGEKGQAREKRKTAKKLNAVLMMSGVIRNLLLSVLAKC